MNSRAALTPATPPAAWAGKRTAMERKESFLVRPAAWKVREATGLKLAPPRISPMAVKVMTRMLTKTVEMKRGARGSVWTPRKAAVWVVKILSRGMENTHMEVNKASPMATLITPMAAAADLELWDKPSSGSLSSPSPLFLFLFLLPSHFSGEAKKYQILLKLTVT
ncbi:hypothetical protein GQ457_14G019050 [Hibiscus cannabinus]